ESIGICRAEVVKQENEIYHGLHSKIEYTKYGHSSLYDTSHGNINSIVFVAENVDFEYRELNVVMFLSDEEDSLPESQLRKMCQKNKKRGSNNGVEVLQQMANIAQTYHDTSSNNMQCKYVKVLNTIHLIDNFTNVANSLLVYNPILMKK
ncbi:8366_t:CDS:2, partial [Gigaspora rosea]